MKRGFAAIERAYGVDRAMLNQHCRLSGCACDRPEALAMLKRIDKDWDKETWGTQATFDDFKAWANRQGKYANLIRQ
jgi:hypothetical protein